MSQQQVRQVGKLDKWARIIPRSFWLQIIYNEESYFFVFREKNDFCNASSRKLVERNIRPKSLQVRAEAMRLDSNFSLWTIQAVLSSFETRLKSRYINQRVLGKRLVPLIREFFQTDGIFFAMCRFLLLCKTDTRNFGPKCDKICG